MRAGRFIVLAILILAAGCSKHAGVPSAAPSNVLAPIVVSAAASTKEAVEALCDEFSKASRADVRVNAGASNTLANQILNGAPADIFFSANTKWASEIEKANLALDSVRLLTNSLVIVVPQRNPGNVRAPRDLLGDRVKIIALAGENVPAGMYANQALTKLELLKPLTDAKKIVRGQDVRSALSFVERGEAEAGIVYSTDVRMASSLKVSHEFDSKLHDEIVYVLVLLKHSGEEGLAKKLYLDLQSPEAMKVYEKFGFSRIGPAAAGSLEK
jgi:molybdate transport system substrate-binding protein